MDYQMMTETGLLPEQSCRDVTIGSGNARPRQKMGTS